MILLSIPMLVLFSCAKHSGDIEEVISSSTITIVSPVPNTVAHYGDSLNINAIAIASKAMHGYDLRITKRSDTTALFFYHGHQHNDTLTINSKWATSVDKPTDLVLSVLVYLDHDGNTSEKKVAFKVQ